MSVSSAVPYRLSAYGCPQIADALASLESVAYGAYPGGDHVVVVGRIVDVQLGVADAPLLYFRRQFLHLAQEDCS